ncbi:hypothetical protein SNS2_3458 [Streptomyces netropsis]|uniref:Uncharacterized protein n=1 Tax=Streptomyces syringium TaxID=76729 RepID=A0ABS4Y846_9ACTN|nr:hypothetical protein [Streptomyces syringium]SPE57808.1 hypothetical protein SNS2_3458 [Streptomyces netropsis]
MLIGVVAKLMATLVAALCVGGFLVAGEVAVLAVVLTGVGALTWRVAVASRPRPPRRSRQARLAPGVSGVRIGHQRDAHVMHDEGRQRE